MRTSAKVAIGAYVAGGRPTKKQTQIFSGIRSLGAESSRTIFPGEALEKMQEVGKVEMIDRIASLVNAKNVTTLTVELLEYLEVCDEEFKCDLAKKTSALALKYSPSKQWYIDTFIALLVRAGQYIDEFECNDFMGLVARTPGTLLALWPLPRLDLVLARPKA